MNIEPLRVCQLTLAGLFAYQGLVPKLLGPHSDELAMSAALGFSESGSVAVATATGAAEVALAAAFLVLPKARWPYLVTLVLMPALLLYALWAVPPIALAAFNPVSLNIAAGGLALIGYRQLRGEGGSDA